ncbi:coiled-coil domain-containing protein 9 [Neosynchiropus ocellatus]
MFGSLDVSSPAIGSVDERGTARPADLRRLASPKVHEDKPQATMSSAVDLKTKEEKDAELDRRIEALRKKNEALVKRYQEIEEDKKKAEQEGIAVTTTRKARPHEPEDRRRPEKENFTVTVDLSKPTAEKRVLNDRKPRGRKTSEDSDGHSPPRRTGSGRVGQGGQRGGTRPERREWEPRTPRDGEPKAPRDGEPKPQRHADSRPPRDAERRPHRDGDPAESGSQGRRGGRRGRGGGAAGPPGGGDRKNKEWEEKRRQNIEKMNEEMERIAEYERGQLSDGDKPLRNFLDDPRRSGPVPDSDRKEGSRRHVRNWGGLDFDNVKTGAELEREWTSRRPGQKGSVDMTMSMTGRERAEYLRWKKEREQIDEERLARHRNATGQWRREWDMQKTDTMFKEDPSVTSEGMTSEGGGRRDDGRRPPRAPTFGDFVSQGRSQGHRGDRGRGKGRGQKQSYSMHDNRWEGEKEEEEEREKQDRVKKEENVKKEKPKTAPAQAVEPKPEDEDEDEWEDASDGEVEEEGSEQDEKRDTGNEKPSSAGSPKEQRTHRPKVHIPAPAPVPESPEGAKPISPFTLPEGYRPVTDWGEEMEMLSPRGSMGGDSPLKPSSTESSPAEKKEQQEERQADVSVEVIEPEDSERREDEDSATAVVSPPSEQVHSPPVPSEPESGLQTPPPDLSSEESDSTPSAVSVVNPSEAREAAALMEQDSLEVDETPSAVAPEAPLMSCEPEDAAGTSEAEKTEAEKTETKDEPSPEAP